ncbi:hypothetical protein [Intestinibacter sp.]
MKKITFKTEMLIVLVILGIGHLVGYLTTKGIAMNIAWIICGLLYILIPAYPNPNGMADHKKGVTGMRIAGVIIVLFGIITSFGV